MVGSRLAGVRTLLALSARTPGTPFRAPTPGAHSEHPLRAHPGHKLEAHTWGTLGANVALVRALNTLFGAKMRWIEHECCGGAVSRAFRGQRPQRGPKERGQRHHREHTAVHNTLPCDKWRRGARRAHRHRPGRAGQHGRARAKTRVLGAGGAGQRGPKAAPERHQRGTRKRRQRCI